MFSAIHALPVLVVLQASVCLASGWSALGRQGGGVATLFDVRESPMTFEITFENADMTSDGWVIGEQQTTAFADGGADFSASGYMESEGEILTYRAAHASGAILPKFSGAGTLVLLIERPTGTGWKNNQYLMAVNQFSSATSFNMASINAWQSYNATQVRIGGAYGQQVDYPLALTTVDTKYWFVMRYDFDASHLADGDSCNIAFTRFDEDGSNPEHWAIADNGMLADPFNVNSSYHFVRFSATDATSWGPIRFYHAYIFNRWLEDAELVLPDGDPSP